MKKEIYGVEGEYIGLPFSPPYLSIMGSVTKTGLNFASAACGILPETGYNFVSFFPLPKSRPDHMYMDRISSNKIYLLKIFF